MRVLGLTFAGTSTEHRAEMTRLLRDVLSLPSVRVEGVEADVFLLPDGSIFAVASPGGMGDSARSVGFLVDDLDDAARALRAAGVDVDEPTSNERDRYVHFRAPDGHLYELVERLSGSR
jgi:catechol 2,3-dioxygenase-like lactoylglutathione lyase family enzyme